MLLEGNMRKTSYILLTLFLSLVVVTTGCRKSSSAGAGAGADGTYDSSGQAGGDGSGDAAGSGADSAAASAAASSLTPIFFNFDQSTLNSTARQTLAAHYEVMRGLGSSKFVVEGHCDNRGTEEYNLALGEQRARAIRDYLVNLGLASSKLSIISYGEERPAVSGENESAWAQNRRGEFVLVSE